MTSLAHSSYDFRAIDWKRIGLFWLLACLISWGGGYLAGALMPAGSWAASRIDTSIPVSLGPLLAGLLVFRRVGPVSWAGSQPLRSWLILALLPLGWLVAAGTGYDITTDALTRNLLFTVSVLVYCVGEEWGWRGFLYEALLPLPVMTRSVVSGLLWFGWHFVFYKDLLNLNFALTFLGMILIGAYGLNAAVTRTRSVAVVVCLHALTKTSLPAPYSWAVIGAIIVLLITWPSNRVTTPVDAETLVPEEH
ncbi:CPBP family intramembrane glutamic endopeptidase [Spirosoma sp. 209]|uniref:CPBP family intramembrane glutamic endopeptidase n=1 Tax=Spirosoma sp. 209 TaxID=1955701 RepID=UPI00098D7232|nr:CPBP family intramembrane glutamic endopeptidase [Spirosoma sp. 209]